MKLTRWIQLNGVRRGVKLWRVDRRFRNELSLAKYTREHEREFRMSHGEKPRLTGYRRR